MKGERNIVQRLLGLMVLSIFIFHFLPSYAQPRLRAREFYLGVHGGVTASSVLFNPAVSNMTPITNACVLGGNGGITFRYAGHKYCAFQMELNYVHRGWAEKNAAGDHYERNLHYVNVPILMYLNFGSRTCRWIFNLGPQLGYCVKDEGNKGVLVNGLGQTEYQPIDHPFYWGLMAGTGVSFPTVRAGIYEIEARFEYAFGGVFGTSLTDHFAMASPMDLSVNFVWMWPIKKKTKIQ
ncbi:MAG: PorT family protein [Paludibacteraceae bacterium]|nr:PorT family protein [Paludibacteraceae bacterium]